MPPPAPENSNAKRADGLPARAAQPPGRAANHAVAGGIAELKPPAPGAAAGDTESVDDLHTLLYRQADDVDHFTASVGKRRRLGNREPVSRIFESVTTWGEFTFDSLVGKIDEHPPGADFIKYYNTILSKFQLMPLVQEGALPSGEGERKLLLDDSGQLIACQGRGQLVVGLCAQRKGKNRDPEEIKDKLTECLTIARDYYPGLKNAEHRLVYLLLSEEQYRTLSQLVQNPAARKQYLSKIDVEKDTIELGYAMISNAILKRASDIHIEPMREGQWRVRFRVDGALQDIRLELKDERFRFLVARFKNMANLKMDEHRRPQSGEISFRDDEIGKGVDLGMLARNARLRGYSLRVEVVPTKFGESLTMRLLSSTSEALNFTQLGFSPETQARVRSLFEQPDGIVVVTGPTGSGKSTTLYAGLSEINQEGIKILSAEEPVERYVPGMTQVAIKREVDLDFPKALRSFLRADPDVILIGEIRDEETAKIAVQAANTGHLVFTTLHTNDAVLAVRRLLDFGIEPFMVQDTVRAVVAQRLVRLLCPACIDPYDAREELNRAFGKDMFPTAPKKADAEVDLTDPDAVYFYRPAPSNEFNPCSHCKGAGYLGRTVVPEVWVLGDEEQDLISRGELSHRALFEAALHGGMVPMFNAGLELALRGKTSFQELKSNVIRTSQFRSHAEIMRDWILGKQKLYHPRVAGGRSWEIAESTPLAQAGNS